MADDAELNDEDREEMEREEMRLDLRSEEEIERIEMAVEAADRIGCIRTRVDVYDLRALLALAKQPSEEMLTFCDVANLSGITERLTDLHERMLRAKLKQRPYTVRLTCGEDDLSLVLNACVVIERLAALNSRPDTSSISEGGNDRD